MNANVDDGPKDFSNPFTHWLRPFPRYITVAPVVRGYGGCSVH